MLTVLHFVQCCSEYFLTYFKIHYGAGMACTGYIVEWYFCFTFSSYLKSQRMIKVTEKTQMKMPVGSKQQPLSKVVTRVRNLRKRLGKRKIKNAKKEKKEKKMLKCSKTKVTGMGNFLVYKICFVSIMI